MRVHLMELTITLKPLGIIFKSAKNDSKTLEGDEVLELLSARIRRMINGVSVNHLEKIAILPEKRSSNKLSDRAIPYLFNYNALKNNWAIETDLLNRLNYGTMETMKTLKYSFENKDFFRIEGHIGKSRKEALEQLNQIREDYNLEFDIKAVYVDEPELTQEKNCCSYEALGHIYDATSHGFKALLKDSMNLYQN